MSASPTLVTREHFEYIAAHTRPEDEFLTELKAAAKGAGIPAIWISTAQANLLQIMLKAAGARQVIDVGTLAGVSAILLARALPPGGRVRTIERDPKHAAFAREWIGKSEVAGRIELHEGDAADVLQRFGDDEADAAFLDADKSGYPGYLRECLRIVRVGGLILADNAFAFGQLFDAEPTDREVPAVRAFNDLMAAEPRAHGVIVPIGDGCWVSVRER